MADYTVRDLIADALEEIGAKDPFDALLDEEADRGLSRVRLMADTQEADSLMAFTPETFEFPLTANQKTNTIGSGANFDTAQAPRPSTIIHVGVVPVGDTMELEVVPYQTRGEYLAEVLKELTNAYPYRHLYEKEWPNGRFTWWPVPTTAATVRVTVPKPVSDASTITLDTVLSFPPGYKEAWLFGLARRLCRPFRRQITDDLRRDERTAMETVRRLNDEGPPAMTFEENGNYDIRTNQYRTTS